ncbi:unnamed protein product [Fusarium fujikuroi]|nr:unnamed protein product [Fusarium fujikuroi]
MSLEMTSPRAASATTTTRCPPTAPPTAKPYSPPAKLSPRPSWPVPKNSRVYLGFHHRHCGQGAHNGHPRRDLGGDGEEHCPLGSRAEMQTMKGEIERSKGQSEAVEGENSARREVANDVYL